MPAGPAPPAGDFGGPATADCCGGLAWPAAAGMGSAALADSARASGIAPHPGDRRRKGLGNILPQPMSWPRQAPRRHGAGAGNGALEARVWLPWPPPSSSLPQRPRLGPRGAQDRATLQAQPLPGLLLCLGASAKRLPQPACPLHATLQVAHSNGKGPASHSGAWGSASHGTT